MRNLFGLVAILAASINLTACDKKPEAQVAGNLPPACENYLQKYQACLKDKVPAAAQSMLETGMKQTREAWEKAAATPEGKAGLTSACEQATAVAKTSMKNFGCDM
jgi:hypothetical protein